MWKRSEGKGDKSWFWSFLDDLACGWWLLSMVSVLTAIIVLVVGVLF